MAELTDSDAQACGEADLGALRRRLGDGTEPPATTLVWRVTFTVTGPDDRIELGDRPAEGDELETYDLSFSPDGRRLTVGGALGLLSVFDLSTGAMAHEPVKVQDHFIQQVEWTTDGQTVVTSGADGTVALYDVARDLVGRFRCPGPATCGRRRIWPTATPTCSPAPPTRSLPSAVNGPVTGTRWTRPCGWPRPARSPAGTSPRPSGRVTCRTARTGTRAAECDRARQILRQRRLSEGMGNVTVMDVILILGFWLNAASWDGVVPALVTAGTGCER